MRLSASLLSADFTNLIETLNILEKKENVILHFDVMDGHFVDNISMGIPILESIRKKTNLILDVHLMISNPKKYIDAFAKAGADIINFHLEAVEKFEIENVIEEIRKTGKKCAITIKPDTPVQEVLPYLHLVDMVLVMSVNPGFGGQKFMENSLEKVETIKKFAIDNGLDLSIEIDGGVNLDNIQRILDSGVDTVVVGSALFKGNLDVTTDKYLEIIRG